MITSEESSVDVENTAEFRGAGVPKRAIKGGPAERLAKLREVMGFETQMSFAAYLGVGYERYNNVERGLPLSYRLARIIARKCPGVTTGWLLEGDASGMTPQWIRLLTEPPKGSSQGG